MENIIFEKKELSRHTHNQNHLPVHIEKAMADASYLNFLQKEINEIFTESVSLILLVNLCKCIHTIFSLVSESNNNIFIVCGTLSITINCIIISILCCNSSRNSEVQVIYEICIYISYQPNIM